ncbi:MAG: pantoate--beta-alanine ligase [Gemmatimonadetes bacterium]|nr:pantoate--beta-alanine ligase [Gemmatimonadota bacterium]
MICVATKAEVRGAVMRARQAGQRVALVPTMGYLHEGHLSLVDRARRQAEWVALSIFVNPLQFGPSEDLARYPRDLERDLAAAGARGVDLVFAPEVAEMYPHGEPAVVVVAEHLQDRLCGAVRPGHFRGVLTVVAKLLGIVRPDTAVFGQKDFQQSVLIRRMVRDLDIEVEIDVAPTVREADGVAMSSRNSYLRPDERAQARALYEALSVGRDRFRAGWTVASDLLKSMRAVLSAYPLVKVEYLEVVDAETLESLSRVSPGCVAAVAAYLGETRLIDNVVLD